MNPSPVGLLALARLLLAGEKGEARKKIGSDLGPMADEGRLGRALEDLESTGAIGPILDKKGRATARVALTDAGRRAALDALGLERLPPKTTWAKLKSTHLVALALGRPGRVVGALKAEVLRSHHGLELVEKPTARQAGDAMAAKLLGLESGAAFTAEAILRKLLRDAGIDIPVGKKPIPKEIGEALLRRELGDPSAKQPLDRLATRAVGARKAGDGELAEALLRGWIGRSEPAPSAPAPGPIDLAEFARRVVEAGRSSPTGRFGDAKVFISHVWRAVERDPAFGGMTVDDFKARLVLAHRDRLIELGRADLVEAMDPVDVLESATHHLDAVYHLMRL